MPDMDTGNSVQIKPTVTVRCVSDSAWTHLKNGVMGMMCTLWKRITRYMYSTRSRR